MCVAAETGVVMLIYLYHAYTETVRQRREEGQQILGPDLHASIIEGSVDRVRPRLFGKIGCGRSHQTSALPKLTGATDPEPLVSRVGGPISQRLSGFDGAARVLKKHEVLVVELHYRENERRADTEQ